MSGNPYKNAKATYPGKTTIRAIQAFSLNDTPKETLERWLGYFHNVDPTVLPGNCLTYPSINCFIPNKDKIVPRLGTTLLGQPYTDTMSWAIIGHKKRFATMGGYEVEVRVTQTDDSNLKDKIEVLYPNPATGINEWYQITQNVNPLLRGVSKLGMRARYYFDDWFDTNINLALNLKLSRLIGVNGTNQVINWTGGLAPITAIVVNTSIRTTPGVTWASLGFVDPSLGGSGNVVINGLLYAITGGWATDTLTLTNTTGISVNDVALSQIQADNAPIEFDVCRQNKNYMFYGNWNARQLYMSNGFGRDAQLIDQTYNSVSGLNDAVFTGDYTGTTEKVFKVTIDSAAGTPTYSGQGSNNLQFDMSGYSGSGNNKYQVIINQIVDAGGNRYWYFITYKNGARVFGPTTFQDPTTGTANLTETFSVADGITFFISRDLQGDLFPTGSGPYTSYSGVFKQGDSYSFQVPDTFTWSLDGVPQGSNIPVSLTPVSLSDGISVNFTALTGHAIGDTWNVTGSPSVLKPWINFYYALPVRHPGEGYIYQLPSNFWTMAPQESEMYVNTRFGQWSYIETVLSADLQSETVSLTPLKQVSSSKVIFPYMINYLDDDLIYVTANKTLDTIGRKELLQLPQTTNLSQPVALDFQLATFVDGSMEYLNKTMYITSPKETIMLVYDNQPGNKYWQPPQMIPENGILSIIENTLITHSNIRNQTYNLFTGTSGDNQGNYTVRARTAYISGGNRWGWKNSNMSFIEGYVTGNPPMTQRVYLGVNGCGGIKSHLVKPVVCIPPTKAPFGQGNFGSHPNGSDVANPNPHFNEIYEQYKPILQWRFAALEMECIATNHSYSWLSMGLNEVVGNRGNNDLKNQELISKV